MAARHNQAPAAPQHQRPAAPQMAKPQQPQANKNRRALGDIGNLVNAPRVANGKPAPQQISRPITRSFGAQLLRNAQVNAQAGGGNRGAVGAAVAKPRQQHLKAPIVAAPPPKPQPTSGDSEVVEISACDFPKNNNACNSVRRHKKKHGAAALTAVLTARSKAACGIVDDGKKKTKKKISISGGEDGKEMVAVVVDPDSLPLPDIDSGDADNQLAVSEYVEDIYRFYKQSETWCRTGDYMPRQTEINAKMRAILADWLVEVHHKFELMPETLYLTLHVVDRYLASEPVPRRELQLVGVAAMLIACKYEEIWAPEVHDFICISDRAYDREQILGMEKQILNRLQWSLTLPTPYVFLVRFIKASANTEEAGEEEREGGAAAAELEHMTFYLAELGLIQYQTNVAYVPSMLAAAAVYLARRTLGKKPCWTETLRRHTGYGEGQLQECAVLLAKYQSAASDGKLRAVYRKYLSQRRGVVSAKPPCRELIEHGSAEEGKASS